MSRDMIVGRDHLVGGGASHPDYDELMEIGAAPHEGGHHAHSHHGMHPAAHHPHAFHPSQHQAHHPHYPPEFSRHNGGRVRIVKEEPTRSRQFPIGFEGRVPNGGKVGTEFDIEVKPQVLFRGERLAVPPSIARYFDIVDIKVGKDSQLAASGILPAEAFETRAVGVRMELDTAEPGIVITLRVRVSQPMPDNEVPYFKAVLYGAVLE